MDIPREQTQIRKDFWKTLAAIFLPAIAVLIMFFFLFGNYIVPTGSMIPTLGINDRVIGLKIGKDKVYPGDIIIFDNSAGWANMPKETLFIKRVVAIEGQTIECCSPNGHIIIDGVEQIEEYLGSENILTFPPQTIPAGHVFVAGDNRADSYHSRYHIEAGTQFISLDRIEAKAIITYWPITNFKIL